MICIHTTENTMGALMPRLVLSRMQGKWLELTMWMTGGVEVQRVWMNAICLIREDDDFMIWCNIWHM